MKKLLVALTALLINSSAFAFSWDSKQENINLTAGVSDSREGAYKLGRQFASNIEQSSPKKLKRTLAFTNTALKQIQSKLMIRRLKLMNFQPLKGMSNTVLSSTLVTAMTFEKPIIARHYI
ncbi:DUF3316 domain-containing protein [Photobacterium sanguinicancri]|uniref:DUF3316 domain-containing protein n=1 Tax=Photobacterium sanguinicancri TaxID=875932 RepID=UPI000B15FD5E|nr:DUF3316 domain-containing protein [Photobacterium sanguinicancri]